MRIQRKPKARFGPSRMVDTSYNYLTLLRCVFIRVIVEAKVEALILQRRGERRATINEEVGGVYGVGLL